VILTVHHLELNLVHLIAERKRQLRIQIPLNEARHNQMLIHLEAMIIETDLRHAQRHRIDVARHHATDMTQIATARNRNPPRDLPLQMAERPFQALVLKLFLSPLMDKIILPSHKKTR
jgi:hypothetical protein